MISLCMEMEMFKFMIWYSSCNHFRFRYDKFLVQIPNEKRRGAIFRLGRLGNLFFRTKLEKKNPQFHSGRLGPQKPVPICIIGSIRVELLLVQHGLNRDSIYIGYYILAVQVHRGTFLDKICLEMNY
jgi:hypothetical protein